MTKEEALARLDAMSDKEIDTYLNELPCRTRLCVMGGLVDWRDVLPEWALTQPPKSWEKK